MLLLAFLVVSLQFSLIASFLDIEELTNAKFGIEIAGEPISSRQSTENTLNVVSRHGQPYRCTMPSKNEIAAQIERNPEVDAPPPEPDAALMKKLLARLVGSCIHKTKGWWTYEFCYNKYVRQYHLEGGKPVGKILLLGQYEETEGEETSFEGQSDSSSKSTYVHEYVSGDKCDLTGLPRRTRVKFVCGQGSGNYIVRVEEPASCTYVLYVSTMHICHHPFFKPKELGQSLTIRCSPLLKRAEYESYRKAKEESEPALDALYEPGEEHDEAIEYEKIYDEKNGGAKSEDAAWDGGSFPMENVMKKLMGMLSAGEKVEAGQEKGEEEEEDKDQWKVRVKKVKQAKEKVEDEDEEKEKEENSVEMLFKEAKERIEKAFKEKLEEAGVNVGGGRLGGSIGAR